MDNEQELKNVTPSAEMHLQYAATQMHIICGGGQLTVSSGKE